jgi:hypothetical protein
VAGAALTILDAAHISNVEHPTLYVDEVFRFLARRAAWFPPQESENWSSPYRVHPRPCGVATRTKRLTREKITAKKTAAQKTTATESTIDSASVSTRGIIEHVAR